MTNKFPRRITSDMLFDSAFTDLFKNFNNQPALGIGENAPAYPHFNVSDIYNDYYYDVEVSLAGFTKDNIEVQFEPYKKYSNTNMKVLNIRAFHEQSDLEGDGKKYIYENIARRDANLSLLVGKEDNVVDSGFVDGILYLTLEKPHDEKGFEKIEI